MAGIDYYCGAHTVVGGAAVTLIDLAAELGARAFHGGRHVQIRTDKDLTVRFNEATADAILIDVSVNPEFIADCAMHISAIYLETVGGCPAGNATVQVLVM